MKYTEYFQKKSRATGETFIYLKDGSPQDLIEFVREVHTCMGCGLPNDWIYEKINLAFEEIEHDELDIEGYVPEGDIYNYVLIEWLSNPFALDLCEEAREEWGNDKMSLMEQIQHGQVQGLTRIYSMVNEFLKANVCNNDE